MILLMTEKMDVQLMELRMIQEYENMLTQLESVSSCNRMERKNEEILLVVRDFFMNPTHAKKEAVLKYVSQTSVSENDYRGRIVAYTDCFNIVLSLIYLYGYQMKFPEIKLYVYRCLVDVSIIEHSFAIFREQLGCDIPQYSPQNLVTNLYIYFLAYTYFRYSDDNKIDSIYTALFYVADSWILSMADDVINSNLEITNIYMPKIETTTKTFEDVIDAIQNKGLTIKSPIKGDVFTLGNASLEVMTDSILDEDNLNLSSITLLMKYGNNSFLFMGDSEEENENTRNWSKVDLLKVGHHGSSTSSSDKFLNETRPKYSVIMAGEGNSYGLPTEKTLNKLSDIGSTIYRTDLNGTIEVTSDGEEIQIQTEK